MPSERVQRRIHRLLDEAEQALDAHDWPLARERCLDVLRLDPENEDARGFLAAADREPGEAVDEAVGSRQWAVGEGTKVGETPALPSVPHSFAAGRYVVKRFLGEGGKKRVYLAHDTVLDRDVAFALIKTEGLDDVARQRVSREAQAMGRLGTHPHIVTVFDLGDEAVGSGQSAVGGGAGPTAYSRLPIASGQGGEGRPYIVTELMGGGDVEGLLEKAPEHRPPLERILQIGIEVCRGLEFAHSHGIVHRDLKPGNVWLTEATSLPGPLVDLRRPDGGRGGRGSDEGGVAKIGDFGLAVALDRSRLTQAGMMVGTVSYMPPEQAMGGEVTPRSDLYSLGAMLYEMVTGRPPFVGDENVAIIGQHLNTPPVAPSWHRPDCPPGLEALILRLLEKDPAKRPASAGEVRTALESVALAAAHPSSPALLPHGEKGEEGGAGTTAYSLLPTASKNPLYRRVFVGREAELHGLQAAFDAALGGQGALAMVVGEPGIGKTAVCEQLATYATLRGGTTLWGHCYEEGSLSLPYLAFVEALRSYAQSRPPEALRQELGTAATDVARIVSEVREQLQIEPRPAGDPEEDRWRLLEAVSGFLRNAAGVQPLLLVLEDLHWADQGTLDLLVHLARSLQGARLLVVGTYRDVEVDRAHPLSATLGELRRNSSFSRVALRGLGTPEVQRMLEAITGGAVAGSLAETIHRQTEGNPLFVQEVVRFLVEEGHLEHGGLSSGTAALSIPEGLRDVIGRRLSRLSPDCNRLLAVAAVIGRDFGLETLQAVADLNEEQVVLALEESLHVGVLEEQSQPGLIRYRFAHAFFRQTLYEELIAPRRLRLHQQVAASLERQYASRLEEHAAELAEHYSQSTDREDLRKAVRYGELAAGRAMAVYAYGEAVRHLDQALAVQEVLDPDDQTERCELLLALGEALVSEGDPTRAMQSIAPEALSLAEGTGNRRSASRACRIVQRAIIASGAGGGGEQAQTWSQLADRHADDGTIDRVYADIFLAGASRSRGDDRSALDLYRRATRLAQQLKDPVALVAAATWPLNGGSTPPEAHEERITLAEELNKHSLDGIESTSLANTLLALSYVYLTWGRREEAERYWRRAKEAVTRSHDASIYFVPYAIEALRLTLDGHFDQTFDIADQVRARAVDVDQVLASRPYAARVVRRALIYLGRADEALGGILDVPDLFNAGGVFAGQRALCLAHAGRVEEGAGILHRMMAARDMSRHDDPTSAAVLRYLLEAAVVARDVEAARVLEARMAPLAGLLHTEAEMCYCIGRLCGGAAALLGEPEKARGYYQQAIEICTRVRFRPELALTRLEVAELLLGQSGAMNRAATPEGEGSGSVGARHAVPNARAGETPALPDTRAEALAHLDFAIAEFREMKMQPALERALRHKALLRA